MLVEDKHYIYSLSDPRDNTVRYIGKSKNPKQRLGAHFALANGNPEKQQWMIDLKRLGFYPVLSIIEEVANRGCAKEREQYWIRFYLEQGVPLLNSHGAVRYCFDRGKEYHLKLPPDLAVHIEQAASAQGYQAYFDELVRRDMERQPKQP